MVYIASRRRRRPAGGSPIRAARALARRAAAAQGMAGLGASDPLIWTPNAIKSLGAVVDNEIETLARDYSAERSRTGTAVISDATLKSFKVFYNEWIAYRDSVGWFSGIWGATADRYKDFRERALAWRQLLIKGGGRASAPAPNVAPPGQNADLLKWGLLLAGGFLVVRVVSEAGILRRVGRTVGGAE